MAQLCGSVAPVCVCVRQFVRRAAHSIVQNNERPHADCRTSANTYVRSCLVDAVLAKSWLHYVNDSVRAHPTRDRENEFPLFQLNDEWAWCDAVISISQRPLSIPVYVQYAHFRVVRGSLLPTCSEPSVCATSIAWLIRTTPHSPATSIIAACVRRAAVN